VEVLSFGLMGKQKKVFLKTGNGLNEKKYCNLS
jgi:hypothetical protein